MFYFFPLITRKTSQKLPWVLIIAHGSSSFVLFPCSNALMFSRLEPLQLTFFWGNNVPDRYAHQDCEARWENLQDIRYRWVPQAVYSQERKIKMVRGRLGRQLSLTLRLATASLTPTASSPSPKSFLPAHSYSRFWGLLAGSLMRVCLYRLWTHTGCFLWMQADRAHSLYIQEFL